MKEGWIYVNFQDCILKIPKQKQVKSKDYQESGLYPIVSQESEIVSGYCDNKDFVFHHETPVVIFGDHTKCLKYIDFDFVVGADGTQILMPNNMLVCKYFYYALKSIKLRDLGYARHFKLLKEKSIPVPPLSEQQQIVDLLDAEFAKIDELKNQAEQSLQNAKDLFQAALKEMLTPKEGWKMDKLKALTSKIGSGATPKGGRNVYIEEGCSQIRSMNVYNYEFKYDELAHISEQAAEALKGVEIKSRDVLFNITGGSIARCCVVPDDVIPARVNQHVSILRPKDDLDSDFLCFTMISPEHQKILLEIGEAGSTRQAITKADLEEHQIDYPTISEQKRIVCDIRSALEKCKQLQSNYTRTIQLCADLKQALLRQVFE